jgi:hypothetical protein
VKDREELALNGVANDDVTPLDGGVVGIIVDHRERS